jgi:hypothetical protein
MRLQGSRERDQGGDGAERHLEAGAKQGLGLAGEDDQGRDREVAQG